MPVLYPKTMTYPNSYALVKRWGKAVLLLGSDATHGNAEDSVISFFLSSTPQELLINISFCILIKLILASGCFPQRTGHIKHSSTTSQIRCHEKYRITNLFQDFSCLVSGEIYRKTEKTT